jgi:hypothetical protein
MSRMSAEWLAYWSGLRTRRILAAVSAGVLLAAWIAFGPAGLLVGYLFALASYVRLRAFPCPRCGTPVVGVRLTMFPDRCEGCDLQLFAYVSEVQASFERRAGALALSRRLRRVVAGYEMAAGGTLMLMLPFFLGGPLWFAVMWEGLGAMSIAAGWWLWHDEPRGYALTRSLQLAQLVRLQSPWLVYVATAGFAFDLVAANGSIELNPSFAGALTLRFNAGMPFGVAVNLWATAVFMLLLHARPHSAIAERSGVVAGSAEPPGVQSPPISPLVDGGSQQIPTTAQHGTDADEGGLA